MIQGGSRRLVDDRRLFRQGGLRLCKYHDEAAVLCPIKTIRYSLRRGTATLDEYQGLTW